MLIFFIQSLKFRLDFDPFAVMTQNIHIDFYFDYVSQQKILTYDKRCSAVTFGLVPLTKREYLCEDKL